MCHAAVISYFAAHDANLSLMNRTGQALAYRQPSFGVFSTSLDPVYRFGIPYQVKMGGLAVDMDAVAQSVWAENHDSKISKASVQQLGMLMSALEHRIPELFFTNEQNPGEAVSAVKALALASAQGQKIYQITSANVGVLNGLNIGTEVKSDIAAAIEVGREVTVSEGMITVAGWSGVGYIISDPATGSGAYKISGGGNGADYYGFFAGYFTALTILAFVASEPFIGMFLLWVTLCFIALGMTSAYLDGNFNTFFHYFFCGAFWSLSLITLIGGFAKIITELLANIVNTLFFIHAASASF